MNRTKRMLVLPALRARSLVMVFAVALLAIVSMAVFGFQGLACLAVLPFLAIVTPEEEFQKKVLSGVEGLQAQMKAVEEAQKKYDELLKSKDADMTKVKEACNELSQKLLAFQKAQMALKREMYVSRKPGFVTDECARHIGAIMMLVGLAQDKFNSARKSWAEGFVREMLGDEVMAKTALTSSDIPLPEQYGSEVSELVSQYGLARQHGTVFPLGAATVKLPRLKTDPAFELLTAATAIKELSPQLELVTFSPEKFGGMVRVPSEIDEDSVTALGQFLARYCARRMAAAEDHQFFVGTGAATGVNGTAKGLTALVSDNTKTTGVAAAGGKTAYSDTTLAVWRELRSVVDEAAIANGAYYVHRTFEQHFSGLNTAGDKPYQANRGQNATLDGFPIVFVPSLPAFSKSANAGKVYALFGDISYMYLGIRRGMEFASSKEAGFTTDEILVRALERMTVGLMATGAMAGLKTPAN